MLSTMLAIKLLLERFQAIGLQLFHVVRALAVLGNKQIVAAGLHGCFQLGLAQVLPWKVICAVFVARFTATSSTPSVARIAFSTWATQLAQVMPVTG